MSSFSQREAFLSVDVDGPGSFVRALAKADKTLKRQFVAPIRGEARAVRDDARARYRGRYRQRSGDSVKGITSREAFGSARIRLERSKPWLVGQEWGGLPSTLDSRGRPFGTRFVPGGAGPAVRGGTSGVGGTFLWPAVTASTERITTVATGAIDDVINTLKGRRG